MSNAKEIRGQIKSTKSTQKITKAMEMVAASKMRRSQNNMQAGRPYSTSILHVVSHLVHANSDDNVHPFLQQREEVKNVGYIVVGTDRGLCGGLNINMFKTLIRHIHQSEEAGYGIKACVFGRKAIGFLSRLNVEMLSTVDNYGDNPPLHELVGGIRPMIDAYRNGEVDKVYIIASRFVNTMTQEPYALQFLPATAVFEDHYTPDHSWDYIYEPAAYQLLDKLALRYLEALVKQAVLENIACEMVARMIAMKNASDNAGNLIAELQLKYNKARQAAITQELSEIVGGAAAV